MDDFDNLLNSIGITANNHNEAEEEEETHIVPSPPEPLVVVDSVPQQELQQESVTLSQQDIDSVLSEYGFDAADEAEAARADLCIWRHTLP